MEHSVENLSSVQRKISVTIPAEEVSRSLDKAIRRFGADLTLPGFRKGKVPAKVLEKRFGAEIYARATDTILNESVAECIKQADQHPLSLVKFEGELPKLARDQEFSFAFTFDVLPEAVKLPEDLAALEVDVENDEVTPSELAEITGGLLRSMATLEEVTEKRVAGDDDVVMVDVNGTYEGKPVDGMQANNYQLQLKPGVDGKPVSELDELIRTLHAGEEGETTMVAPELFPVEELRGKTISIKCKLHKISREILPELNDETAKKAGMPDAASLRKAIAEQASLRKQRSVRSVAQQKMLDKLLDEQNFDLPESLVQAYVNEYLAVAQNDMMQKGVAADAAEKALENLKEEASVDARKHAKAQTFLMALAQREKLEVSNTEVDRQIYQMAQENHQDFRQLRETVWQNGMAHELQGRILAAKALDLMFNKAKKNTLPVDGKAAEAKAE